MRVFNFIPVHARILVVAGVASLMMLSFVACGISGESTEKIPGGNQDDTITEGAPAELLEEDGAILRISAFPIAQTDPAYISSDSEVLVASQVYDYLVDVDADNQIQPRLAVDWMRSEDGLSYTFTLATGVRFHDGSLLTSEDVVWTFERLRDTDGLPTADLYSNITSIVATGELELTFNLNETNPFFLYDLSDNHALIMKANSGSPLEFNGTGPFVVSDYRPNDRIILQANDKYFVPDQPHLRGLEIIFFDDQAAAVDALRSGQIDLSMDLSTPQFESLAQEPDLNAYDIATNQFAIVRLRTDIPPGNDPLVIQAFKLATDREAIFQLVQKGYGAVGRDTPIGPLFSEYYSEMTEIPDRDPQAARKLLEQAGYPQGLEMELNLLNTLNFPDLAVVLKEQWSGAGIDVQVVTMPESLYYGEGKWLEVPLGITGWGHRPYPQFYLDVMLTCGAKWNETRFCESEFDELVELAGSTLDEQSRVEAYHEIQRILIERGPIIVPYFFAEYGVIDSRFTGFELKAFSGRTDLRTVRVDNQ